MNHLNLPPYLKRCYKPEAVSIETRQVERPFRNPLLENVLVGIFILHFIWPHIIAKQKLKRFFTIGGGGGCELYAVITQSPFVFDNTVLFIIFFYIYILFIHSIIHLSNHGTHGNSVPMSILITIQY